MRKLVKGAKPQVLVENAANWTHELISAVDGNVGVATQSKYRNIEIRDALLLETHRKCAYCESVVGATDYSHIEHIYPKGAFPDKTFDWDNLTISCPKCNIKKGGAVPSTHNFIHPYNDDPEGRVKFLGPIAHHGVGDVSALTFLRWLDLNRAELLERRKSVFECVQRVFDAAMTLSGEARSALLEASFRSMTDPGAEHSQVAKCAFLVFSQQYTIELPC